MDKKNIVAALSVLSFTTILFSPIDSKIWILFLILGLVFGTVWLVKE